MKKKKTTGKRLELNRQTIRTLQEGTLSEVHGGLWSCTCSQGSCASGCCPTQAARTFFLASSGLRALQS